MKDAEMTKSPLWDSVIHADHVHWCDLELNSLATCVAKAHQEHALQWAADVLSFAAIAILLLFLLRPLVKVLRTWNGREFTFCFPNDIGITVFKLRLLRLRVIDSRIRTYDDLEILRDECGLEPL